MTLLFYFKPAKSSVTASSVSDRIIDPWIKRKHPKQPIYFDKVKRKKLKKKQREEILTEIIRAKEIPRARLPEIPRIPIPERKPSISELSKIRRLTNQLLNDILEQEKAFQAAQLIISKEEKRLAEQELALLQQQEQFLEAALKELNARLQQSDDEELLLMVLQ